MVLEARAHLEGLAIPEPAMQRAQTAGVLALTWLGLEVGLDYVRLGLANPNPNPNPNLNPNLTWLVPGDDRLVVERRLDLVRVR